MGDFSVCHFDILTKMMIMIRPFIGLLVSDPILDLLQTDLSASTSTPKLKSKPFSFSSRRIRPTLAG